MRASEVFKKPLDVGVAEGRVGVAWCVGGNFYLTEIFDNGRTSSSPIDDSWRVDWRPHGEHLDPRDLVGKRYAVGECLPADAPHWWRPRGSTAALRLSADTIAVPHCVEENDEGEYYRYEGCTRVSMPAAPEEKEVPAVQQCLVQDDAGLQGRAYGPVDGSGNVAVRWSHGGGGEYWRSERAKNLTVVKHPDNHCGFADQITRASMPAAAPEEQPGVLKCWVTHQDDSLGARGWAYGPIDANGRVPVRWEDGEIFEWGCELAEELFVIEHRDNHAAFAGQLTRASQH